MTKILNNARGTAQGPIERAVSSQTKASKLQNSGCFLKNEMELLASIKIYITSHRHVRSLWKVRQKNKIASNKLNIPYLASKSAPPQHPDSVSTSPWSPRKTGSNDDVVLIMASKVCLEMRRDDDERGRLDLSFDSS